MIYFRLYIAKFAIKLKMYIIGVYTEYTHY